MSHCFIFPKFFSQSPLSQLQKEEYERDGKKVHGKRENRKQGMEREKM